MYTVSITLIIWVLFLTSGCSRLGYMRFESAEEDKQSQANPQSLSLPLIPVKTILSGPSALVKSLCYEYMATTRAANGLESGVNSDLALSLSSSPAGSFFSDPRCSGSLKSLGIPMGFSSRKFYFKPGVEGPVQISAAALNTSNSNYSNMLLANVQYAPVAANLTVSADEDVPKAITLSATDRESSPLTYSVVSGPTHGRISGTPPNLTYQSDQDFNGPDSFTFRANDSLEDSNIATVTINVNPVNDAPIAFGRTISTAEDNSVAGLLMASDIDSPALSYSVQSQGSKGMVVVDNSATGSFRYTPNPNANGGDSFQLRVSDGQLSSIATIIVNISPVNDAPFAISQANVSVTEDTAETIILSGSDVENSPLTFSVVTAPQNGTLSGVAPNLVYHPKRDFFGSDVFTFKVNDGSLNSEIAQVSVVVGAINDAPVANPKSVTTDEDTAVTGTLTASDIDSSDLTYTFVSSTAVNGTVTVSPLGSFAFNPSPNTNGSGSFQFQVSDGALSSTATIIVNINPVNDAPVAFPLPVVAVMEDIPESISLIATDIDSAVLTYSIVDFPQHGTLVGTPPMVIYQPDTNYVGTDSFSFKAKDGVLFSNIALVSITVSSVNDAPIATAGTFTTKEDTAVTGALTASDIDSSNLTYTFVSNTAVNGSVNISSTGSFTFTPNSNVSGIGSFQFQVADGFLTSRATVTVNIAAVNDAPSAPVQPVLSVNEDEVKNFTLIASDIENSTLTYTIVPPFHGVLSGTPPNLSYRPDQNYFGSDSFSFKVNDGSADSNTAIVSISVASVNDAPIAYPANFTTNEDTAIAGSLLASDVDSSGLTYFLIANSVVNGTVNINSTTGVFIFSPTPNVFGNGSFQYRVKDSTLLSATVTVNLTIIPINDAPYVSPLPVISVDEDTPKIIALTVTDVDTLPANLVYDFFVLPKNGQLSGTPPNLTYSPHFNYVGSDSFSFKVNDGYLNSSSVTVSLLIGPLNDAPVAYTASFYTNEDTNVSGTLLSSDVDSSVLSYVFVPNTVSNGTVNINSTTGIFTFTPNPNFNGNDTFQYKVFDGYLYSSIATVYVTVYPVNDPPSALARTVEVSKNQLTAIPLQATDPDGGSGLDYSFSQSSNGSLSGTAPELFYEPFLDYLGNDSFIFTASDGQFSSSATISIWVIDPIPKVTVSNVVSPDGDTTLIQQNISSTIEGLETVDARLLRYRLVDVPAFGHLTNNGVAISLNGEFTQDEINRGKIKYLRSTMVFFSGTDFSIKAYYRTSGNGMTGAMKVLIRSY